MAYDDLPLLLATRTEVRKIFADDYETKEIDYLFSSWGGIFVSLACQGKAAFRNMAILILCSYALVKINDKKKYLIKFMFVGSCHAIHLW